MTVRSRQVHNLFAIILPVLGILMLLVVSSIAQAAQPVDPSGKVQPAKAFDYHDFSIAQTTQGVFRASQNALIKSV